MPNGYPSGGSGSIAQAANQTVNQKVNARESRRKQAMSQIMNQMQGAFGDYIRAQTQGTGQGAAQPPTPQIPPGFASGGYDNLASDLIGQIRPMVDQRVDQARNMAGGYAHPQSPGIQQLLPMVQQRIAQGGPPQVSLPAGYQQAMASGATNEHGQMVNPGARGPAPAPMPPMMPGGDPNQMSAPWPTPPYANGAAGNGLLELLALLRGGR